MAGQRVANAMAAVHGEFVLLSRGASHVFAKGLFFEAFSARVATEIREVQLVSQSLI